jgi:hypothetical protein
VCVDAALEDRYLEPLRSADIDLTVENTCHLQRATDAEPWHLDIRVQVDADAGRVADILEAQDVVLHRDRDPMMVQQDRGHATRGWNGVLETSEGGAMLGLTYNNVRSGGLGEAGGWAEVCLAADEP